jgi:hypothetical protein
MVAAFPARGWIFVVAALLAHGFPGPARAEEAKKGGAKRPNFVFILADDK